DRIERSVSTEDCVAVATGSATAGEAVDRALSKFDAAQMARWFDISVEGSLRALKNDPAVPVISDEEGRLLLTRASEGMPANLRNLITGQAGAAPPPADLCRLDLALNRYVMDEGSPVGPALMRWLLHPR
ncbi:MAG TPA: hypothetical protein VNP72_08590, partial [Longimicrobium sp.]|nr:hypothetical protein [Longimicrobium sp.]